MSYDLFKGLLIAGLLVLTLPLFYLLFTNVILPTLWQEDHSGSEPAPVIESTS